jgi:hypothetical protein
VLAASTVRPEPCRYSNPYLSWSVATLCD